MARLVSRGNLSAARFPLVSAFHGRTIILPQYDMNYQRNQIFAGADQDRDIGVPQVYYMQNVMPTEQGYQSVGFSPAITGVPGLTDFDQAIVVLDASGNKYLYSPASGKNRIFDAPNLAWAAYNDLSAVVPNNVLVTSAFVQGVFYIFYANNGCYMYNNITKNFDAVVLNGLVTANIVGICGSNGYLLAWDSNGTLYWSSATTPTDFVPSLVTGAGSGAITDVKGNIVCILPANNGFIVYATQNAVGGVFTSNLRFPFNLKEITGSGGIRDKEHVSYESNLEEHYALTSAGLQAFTKNSCKTLLPETSDFITSRIFEDYDDATKLFTVQYITSDLLIKLAVIGARFFVLSYGISSLTHALIYDIVQKKWGKVKIVHVDCFQFSTPNLYGAVTYDMLLTLNTLYSDLLDTTYDDLSTAVKVPDKARRIIGFLQNDGTVQLLNFDLGQINHSAVLLLGKYQFVRGNYIQFFGVEVENVDQGSNYQCFVLPSYDGKNFAPAVTPFLKNNTGLLREYALRNTAQSHTLLFIGSFSLTSVIITYAKGGEIR